MEFRERFHIEPSLDCRNDYLEIRDGAFGYNQLLNQLCDRFFPSSITSTGRYLWLHFHSDENTEYNGFKIVYEFRERPNRMYSNQFLLFSNYLKNRTVFKHNK